MTATMYDLAGIDGRRFSPFCWRTRMAFAHKGVPLETRPMTFTEINANAIDPSERRTVPTVDIDGTLVTDSWTIAEMLDREYPDAPSLFGGEHAMQLTRTIEAWTNSVLHGAVASRVLLDIYNNIEEQDKAYFRESREKRFGRTLEEVQAGRDERGKEFYQNLTPIRLVLRETPFLGGETPLYADYIVFGGFQWARSVSDFKLLDDDDAVAHWRDRMVSLHDGLANSVTVYA